MAAKTFHVLVSRCVQVEFDPEALPDSALVAASVSIGKAQFTDNELAEHLAAAFVTGNDREAPQNASWAVAAPGVEMIGQPLQTELVGD